ncbi:MULE domain-containing protein, partial [Aphis craccivora]
PPLARAIPIAILIHYGQTEESYKGALSLLKLSFPLCFGGKEITAPTVLMTDDSKAEKNALNSL